MSGFLIGLGCAVPPHVIAQPDAALQAAKVSGGASSAVVAKLYQQAGVRTRRSVVLRSSTNGAPAEQDFYAPITPSSPWGPTTGERMRRYESEAAQLAVHAAQRALGNAGLTAADIRQLVTVSCSGFAAPGVDIALVEQLQLAPEIGRAHVGFMGCHGALNGLRVASALQAVNHAPVLLCCVELCSLHHQYQPNAQQMVANALFADGAAAVVIGPQPIDRSDWQLLGQHSVVVPETRDAMSWRIGDHGFEMTLSPRVPELIRARLRAALTAWLRRSDLAVSDIGCWAIHPGGPRILTACAESLGLADDALAASRQVLAEFGNMSSPTLLFVIERLRQWGSKLPCVALAFGPGLTVEAALFGHSPSGENHRPG